MSRKFRWVAIPAVLVALSVGTAQAWPTAPTRPAHSASQSILADAWNRLASLFGRRNSNSKPAPRLSSNQEKECSHLDPNGRCIR